MAHQLEELHTDLTQVHGRISSGALDEERQVMRKKGVAVKQR
jgi:hypothetical protein